MQKKSSFFFSFPNESMFNIFPHSGLDPESTPNKTRRRSRIKSAMRGYRSPYNDQLPSTIFNYQLSIFNYQLSCVLTN